MEKIATLDQQANVLRQENEELANLTLKLKEQVYKLQQELQWHINNGCELGGRASTVLSESETELGPKLSPELASPDSTTLPGVMSPIQDKDEVILSWTWTQCCKLPVSTKKFLNIYNNQLHFITDRFFYEGWKIFLIQLFKNDRTVWISFTKWYANQLNVQTVNILFYELVQCACCKIYLYTFIN